jgi:hypothetical protein
MGMGAAYHEGMAIRNLKFEGRNYNTSQLGAILLDGVMASSFDNLIIENFKKAGDGVGIKFDGTFKGGWINTFKNNWIEDNITAMLFSGSAGKGANSNFVIGGEMYGQSLATSRGIALEGESKGNVIWGTDFDSQADVGVAISGDADYTVLYRPRFESNCNRYLTIASGVLDTVIDHPQIITDNPLQAFGWIDSSNKFEDQGTNTEWIGVSGGIFWSKRANPWFNNRLFVLDEDFLCSALSQTRFTITVGGTGGSGVESTTSDGRAYLTTGGTSGGTSAMSMNGTRQFRTNDMHFWVHMDLSSATQLTVRLGMYRDANNYIWFESDAGAAAVNWYAENCNAGSATSTDTSTLTDTSWHELEFYYHDSDLRFAIDNTLVATNSTNIPTGTFEPYVYIENKENAAKLVYVDRIHVSVDRAA